MKIIEVNNDNFEDEVMNSNISVLVDFNADWCGPCRILGPILEDIASDRDDCKIVSINIDDEEELTQRYGVYSIPCLILIKDGKEIDRSVGLKSRGDIESMLGDK